MKEILPKNSNIIKFQNKFNIIEYEENRNDFLDYVFEVGLENIEYEKLQEKTLLQKELKIMLVNKKPLHLGLGFIKKQF